MYPSCPVRQENPRFPGILARLEEDPICQRLPLTSFLILPFQRITRLKMLVEVHNLNIHCRVHVRTWNPTVNGIVFGQAKQVSSAGYFRSSVWKDSCLLSGTSSKMSLFFRISSRGQLRAPGMRTLPRKLSMSWKRWWLSSVITSWMRAIIITGEALQ